MKSFLRRTMGAVQRVHRSRLTNNSACAEELRGDGVARGFFWVTSAPCGEGEECWDEGCLQERCIFFC